MARRILFTAKDARDAKENRRETSLDGNVEWLAV
jgi:hypothetical protein